MDVPKRCPDGFGVALLRIFRHELQGHLRLSTLRTPVRLGATLLCTRLRYPSVMTLGTTTGATSLALLFAVLTLGCTHTDSPRQVAAAKPAAQPSPPTSAPGSAAAPKAAPPATERIPLRYPFDRVHSPMTPAIGQRLRDIAGRDATLRSDVFAKVGDSITFSDDSYRCLSKKDRNLGAHAALAPVIRRFAGKPEYGTNPYSRDSLTAQIGWSAWQVLSGEPSPLAKELKAIRPRIALVQFGTNDIEIGAIFHFADQLWNIVDYLAERGVVPVLFTIPPRKDKLKAGVWVSRYNAAIRGIAQARSVPLVDYHLALGKLPGGGLAKDGIHPTTFRGRRGRDACDFTKEGLRHGYNLRNLLALQALERVDAALRGGAAPDAPLPVNAGGGSPPLVDVARLEPGSGQRHDYPCRGAKKAPGREATYAFELLAPTHVRIMGFDRGAEAELYLLRSPAGSECVRSHARVITARLGAGTHYLVVDRLSATAAAGETIVVISKD